MSLRFLTAGESHGPALTAILEGLPAGLPLDVDVFQQDLARRQKGAGAGPRMKLERDAVKILGGVMEGVTTGAPLALLIENSDFSRWRGRAVAPFTIPRPGHADLAGAIKYGYHDLRPSLERASARETAARVAVGAACRQLLLQFKIQVGGYVCSIGDVTARLDDMPIQERITAALNSDVSCPDPVASRTMQQRIRSTTQAKDTLGGVIEVAAVGLPAGLGSHVQWDRRLDSRLGAAVLGIQSVKGVEIGPAFENTRLPGTQVQDPIRLEGGRITRTGNRSGGLEGGMTTGQPLLVRAALKPIATTLAPQQSVDLQSGQEVATQYERSDFCQVPRAVVIVEAMVAFVLAAAMIEKLGGDTLPELLSRFAGLRQARLSDLPMDGVEHTWWPE